MIEEPPVAANAAEPHVHLWASGECVKGEFHCVECGYGVAVYRELPLCPMCGGQAWEQAAWSPLTRAGRPQH